jgi:hypothetical protein
MSNANIPVTVFNSSTNACAILVNNGNQIVIPGTGPAQNWVAQQPNPGQLSFSNGYPAPNVLGSMGGNQIQVMINGMPIGSPLHINIPQSGPIFSLQLYIFFSSNSSVSWTLLNNGQTIGSGTA